MKRKKGLITGIIVLVIVILAFVGYNMYRHPAMFRSLSDNSLSDKQVGELREEILSQSEINVLVAYFSYSGTTKNIATAISEKTGGDLFEITPENSYSSVYTESNREIRKNERPALTNTVENMEEYDIVFVGYPVWWHATPAPVNTFLESYNLDGKLIIPFCTSGGSDIDETMPTFLDSCDGLAVYGERRISGTGELDGWLSELGLSERAAESGDETSSETSTELTGEPETTEMTMEAEPSGTGANGGNILVAYFSYTGNTEEVAQLIAEYTGGDLAEIERAEEYGNLQEEAEAEILDGVHPEITVSVDSIAEYDTIFVGYPIWWDEAPAMIATFLADNDFSGKTIVPFCTSSSDDIGNSLHIFSELCPDAEIAEGLTANDLNDIEPWLQSLGLIAADKEEPSDTAQSGGSNILIAYFSVMETDGVDTVAGASRVAVNGEVLGNNEYIARIIQRETGGDLFAIQTVQEYPTTHDSLLDFAYSEKAENARPELAAQIENPDKYDMIFLGYPNWNADLPMPLYTFLEQYDFSGKTIIPFTTHGGSGFSRTVQTISEMQPGATVVSDGLSISRNSVAGAESDVAAWVNGLNLTAE